MVVSATFDPYYKWLGIPKAEQPPNHYRLLGVNLFECDCEVIESAADQRMNYLRTFQYGPRDETSQKLLSEIAAARLCLLNPDRKHVYDDGLRLRMAARSPPSIRLGQMAGFFPKTLIPAVAARCVVDRPDSSRLTPIWSSPATFDTIDAPGAVELEGLGIPATAIFHRHTTANPRPIIPLAGPIYFMVGFLLGALLTADPLKKIETNAHTSGPPHIVAADSSTGDKPKQQRTAEIEHTHGAQP